MTGTIYDGPGDLSASALDNSHITSGSVPEVAFRYSVGSRLAIEWWMDRYQVKVDSASGIRHDFNDWSREVNDPRHVPDLFARVTTASIETMKMIDALASLGIIETAT